MPSNIISELWDVINDRMDNPPPESYVVSVLAHRKGLDKALEKVGEESTEFILAMKNDEYSRKVSEAADLIFHLLIALRGGNVDIEDVFDELAQRRR